MQMIQELGNKHGRLLVIGSAESRGTGAMWKCLCDCGRIVITHGTKLRNGNTRSCGCSRLGHGLTHSKGKTVWEWLTRWVNVG